MPISCLECRHILPGGQKCHLPALTGKPFCMHHCRTRNLVEANRVRRHSIALPPLEDRTAVQMSIDVVLAALSAGKINRRTAATYTWAIKIVSDNLPQMEKAPPPQPIAICRDEHGDVLAANEPTPNFTQTETADATEPEERLPTNLGAPGPSHLGTWESTNADFPKLETATLDLPTEPSPETVPDLTDLRNTSASHEYDPEPPAHPTKTELRQKRREIEQCLKQQREALCYWSNLPPERREKEHPELIIPCIQKTIDKRELQLAEINRLEAPDPDEPDPPL